MKRDIEWLKEEMDSMHRMRDLDRNPDEWFISKTALLKAIDQLDEPEVLSQEWIDKHAETIFDLDEDFETEFIKVDELRNLLVPKQEGLEAKIQELIEAYKQEDGAYSNPENGWIGGFIEDLENLVEEERVMEWLDNNNFYDHRTVETVLANAVDKGELGYYDTKYSVVKKEPETVADVVATFWKSYERLKEVMSMEVEEMEE